MSKLCSVERNKKRVALTKKYAKKRAALKAIIEDKNSTPEQVFEATLKLAKLPRNSSATRIHNRCELTGRSHGFYRKLKLSRIQLRKLANEGQIPGMVKSSW
ncbi:MAG: 30S ribosomal protein S14 [Bacteroidales bacterium]|mgnify:CR=1 FL=1|jgi:small subunit ribosomal protein S14|nr:30S ribosomal protein S14 [Bacteroidales bacterium]